MDKQQIIQLLMAHKVGAALLAFLATSAGANLLVRVLNSIPMEWWFSMLRNSAYVFGLAGDTRFGEAVFSPFEDFIVTVIGKSGDSIRDGFIDARIKSSQSHNVPASTPSAPKDTDAPLK